MHTLRLICINVQRALFHGHLRKIPCNSYESKKSFSILLLEKKVTKVSLVECKVTKQIVYKSY